MFKYRTIKIQKLVQDRKTGQWYDPEVAYQQMIQANVDVFVRLKNR